MQDLFTLAIADQVRNDINVSCHTALDTVSHGFGVEYLRSLGVEEKYRHCERSEAGQILS